MKMKRILAIMLLFLNLFSILQPILAKSGNSRYIGAQYASKYVTTESKNGDGILIRRLTDTNTNERWTVFCAEHGTEFITGTPYDGKYYTPTDSTIKRGCQILYFGWYEKHWEYVVDGGILDDSWAIEWRKEYVFTQQYLWEALGQSNATFVDAGLQSEYENYKRYIDNKIDNIKKRPSFCTSTITVDAGETTTITDENGVLADYKSINHTENGVTFVHNQGENTIQVTVNDDCTLEDFRISDEMMRDWGLIKGSTQDNDTTVYFEFENGQNQLYAFHYNDPVTMSMHLAINAFGGLELQKLNENNDLIDGAIYRVQGPDNFDEEVTVTNGKISLDNLKRGTYTISEIRVPEGGYLLDTNTYSVEVTPNKTATQSIINKEPKGKIKLHKISENNDNIGGAVFSVRAAEDIYNVAKTHLYYTNGQEVSKITTNSNGIAEISNLPMGKFRVFEESAPDGFLVNENVYEVELKYKDNETANIEINLGNIIDEEPTGEITLEKTDRETGNKNRADEKSHHGDATLNGTEYTLYAKTDIYNKMRTLKYFSKDEAVAKFTFNEYGVATVYIVSNPTGSKLNVRGNVLAGLPMGDFYAVESVVPTGYFKDNNTYNFSLKYKNDRTKVITANDVATNQVKKAPFTVIKVSTNDNTIAEKVENAEFTAILSKYVDYYGSFDEAKKHLDEFSEDEYSIFRTDKNGHGTSGLLAYGEYVVCETHTPSPEIETVEPFYVFIDKDSKTPIKELVPNDLPFTAYIKLIKKDKKTGKNVILSNTTFKLYKLKEEKNQWEEIICKVGKDYFDSWTTDKNGIARTENKLEAGKYKVDEVKIADGFLQLDEELLFDVNNRNKTLEYDQDYDAWITVTIENEQPTGTIELDKTVVLREDADTSLVDVSDLSKIQFKLVAKEDIIDMADGSIIYSKGQEINTYNLTKEGKLTITDLPIGKYEIFECATLDNLVLDNTRHQVGFSQKDTTTKVYTENRNIVNDTTFVEFSKIDITGQKELEGAKLTVTDENGEIVDSWISTNKTHKIEGLKVGKTYELTEDIAPDSFVKATSIKFKVENTKEIQKVTMIDKVVEMTKEDINGNEIEGATLVVTSTKTKNIVDKWISTKEPHKITGLIEGENYVLHEEIAVDGFVKAQDIEFTVSTDKETQRVILIDKIVEIVKTDLTTGKELPGAELTVTDKDGNIIDKWISTNEAHRVTGLEEGKEYELTEVTCPYGFKQAESITFKVTTDKETQRIEMKDEPILKTIRIVKADSKTKEIIKANFKFGIYEDENCTKLIKEVKSDKEQGTVTFENLKYGIWYIKETKAPSTYQLSDKVIKVEIDDKGIFVDGEQIEENESVGEFTYYNNKIPKIQTGNETNYIILGLSFIISLLGVIAGVIALKRKQNK